MPKKSRARTNKSPA